MLHHGSTALAAVCLLAVIVFRGRIACLLALGGMVGLLVSLERVITSIRVPLLLSRIDGEARIFRIQSWLVELYLRFLLVIVAVE